MARTLTLDQVQRVVNAVLDGTDDFAYTLEEVAERTGFALTELIRDCKAGRIEHTWRGRTRCMTPGQVAKLMSEHRHGGDDKQPAVNPAQQEAVDLALVRKSSQGAAKRATKKVTKRRTAA
jgi:hypothetical protein